MDGQRLHKAFEEEVGISFNNVTEDGLIGLWDTADIGMNDQDPAAIINGTIFTELDPAKVKKIFFIWETSPTL